MRRTWFADFETTQPNDKGKVEVYLWACVSGRSCVTGRDIASFYEFIKDKKAVIFFHNLKFDFSYLLYYLLKNNIDFQVLEKKGIFYNVKIGKVDIRDSLNFLPMTLKEIGENYCTKFKKTSIEYDAEEGHIASEEEIEYCINDCRVLEEGLKVYFDALRDVLTEAGAKKSALKIEKKMTNAGIAYEAFRELSKFDKICPKTTYNEYQLLRDAYKGGFVYSKPCGIVSNVDMVDCNSMYPYVYANKGMPFGKGIVCTDLEDAQRFPFWIAKFLIKYDLKEGYIPIIGGGVGRYGGINYKSSSNGEYEEVVMCNIDFELIKRFYDIEFETAWVVGWNTKAGMFSEYCETFLKVKNSEKGVKRAVAKVLLNSPYGKTAMNGNQEIKRYYISAEDIVKSEVTGYEVDEDAFQYLPIAIAITAYARQHLLTTAEKVGFENVLYMDTDSIKYKSKLVEIDIDDKRLGAWKNEGKCVYFKTLAPKKYGYWDGSKINITCAGFNKKILTQELKHGQVVDEQEALRLLNKFDKGFAVDCLQSKVVSGGRALLNVKKEIK